MPKINAITVIGVIASLAIGYYLNDLANKKNNKILIAELKAELEASNHAKTRATPDEKAAIDQHNKVLEGQISILEQQLNS